MTHRHSTNQGPPEELCSVCTGTHPIIAVERGMGLMLMSNTRVMMLWREQGVQARGWAASKQHGDLSLAVCNWRRA